MSKTDNGPEVVSISRSVLKVRFEKVGEGWEQWLLLSGDRHHDNLKARHDLERKHLELARERGALIIDVGDLFCAMQGKWDPRSNMDSIRKEDVGADYLDRIKRHAAAFYAPYAPNWLLMSRGNHESNIVNRHGTDLTSDLVSKLREAHGASHLHVGGFGGWIKFMFHIHKTRRKAINLKYHHGAGGGGPVTRGVIQTNRQAVYLPDAHIVVNGHTHDQWVVPIARERLTQQGDLSRDVLYFVRTGTYKDEYGDGYDGYHVEKWGPPKPLGAVWLRFFLASDDIFYELIPAAE